MAESDLIVEQNTMKVEGQDFTPWQPDDQSRVRERPEGIAAGPHNDPPRLPPGALNPPIDD